MTEYELIDAVNSTMEAFEASFMAYLTIVSAYLIAAFISGKKLTQQQAIIISTLFLFASALTMFALWGAGGRIAYTAEALRLVNPEHPILFKTTYRNVLGVVCGLGIFASFKFMWDVRHPKTE